MAAIEAVHAGEMVINEPDRRVRAVNGSDWPGRSEGLTDRESEVLALITQGMSNAEVADLTYLSPNTIKTYIRSVYRKIGATSRTQAVLWGVEHGFRPDKRRIDHWRGGPYEAWTNTSAATLNRVARGLCDTGRLRTEHLTTVDGPQAERHGFLTVGLTPPATGRRSHDTQSLLTGRQQAAAGCLTTSR